MASDRRSVDELKEAGAGRPAPREIVSLYRKAFHDYGVQALWNRTPSDHPTIAQALVVAESLLREGDMKARLLAIQIEEACRAVL